MSRTGATKTRKRARALWVAVLLAAVTGAPAGAAEPAANTDIWVNADGTGWHVPGPV